MFYSGSLEIELISFKKGMIDFVIDTNATDYSFRSFSFSSISTEVNFFMGIILC